MSVIRFEQVVKRFGEKTVLDHVSFSVEAGEVLAIIGPSGTGKSVTLKHIVGLLQPDAGTVTIEAGHHLGYLFQSGALLAWMTVAENVALPLRETTTLKRAEIEARVAKALEAVELLDAADLYPSEISGGMQKRAGLARELVRESDIVLYDEPTSGLDPITANHIHQLIRTLNKERGITSVVVTHDLASALNLADRILLLVEGRVVLAAPPKEFSASALPDVRAFLEALKGTSK